MSFVNPVGSAPKSFSEGTRWFEKLRKRVLHQWRPVFGWPVLICLLGLAWAPAQTARANEWIMLDEFGSTIEPLGPLAVLFTWLLLGWRRERQSFFLQKNGAPRHLWRTIVGLIFVSLVGLIALTQALTGWIPGPIQIIRTAVVGTWSALLAESVRDLAALGIRISRWWNGVLAGGATQDDLVFAALVGMLVWFNGLLIAWLARRTQRGMLAALPSLWLLLNALLYGSAGRAHIIGGLFLALLLQVVLDQRRLVRRWEIAGISYGEGLLTDRIVAVGVLAMLVLGTASVVPNVSIRPLADRYYQLYQPFNTQVEGLGQRLFPDLKATSRFRGSALAAGLPNSFLLGAGPELSQHEVMRVRTDEIFEFDPAALEELPLVGHYMRGGTLSIYDGLGWQNPIGLAQEAIEADTYVSHLLAQEPLERVDTSVNLPRGRRLLTQDVFLAFTSRALYGAAEPISFSIDSRLEHRGAGDQIAFWGNNANSLTSSYTVVSAIPAVNSVALGEEPFIDLNDESHWQELSQHLSLPDTITDRTRTLANELVADAQGPYAAAVAIENYLRTFEYDLSVTEPSEDVIDVADYFLFELQRGYCDYYATAFVVLARLAGLPARFATGFAVGSWSGSEGVWIVTEAEAHSWPEVYFPSYGWIPFEPTAGRAPLQRIGVGLDNRASIQSPVASDVVTAEKESLQAQWSWQTLIWLLPILVLAWFLYRQFVNWQEQREDPWRVILRWGNRIGRPIGRGETVLEYGRSLGQFVLSRFQERHQDRGRIVARELETITEDLSFLRYGTLEQRKNTHVRVLERWQSLRAYLRSLR